MYLLCFNFIGIDDDDVAPVSVAQQTQTPPLRSPTPPPSATPPKHPTHLVTQLQTPSQVGFTLDLALQMNLLFFQLEQFNRGNLGKGLIEKH